ncbi:MAG: histidine kinase [Nitrospirae bacterium]|nr:histidine kinase [Nitrospirota bacterium]
MILNSVQSLMRWGYISRDLIEIGAIDALINSLIIAPIIIYLLKASNENLKRETTESRATGEALQKSEMQLRSTLEATVDGILAVDNWGKVTLANRRFAELWRIPQTLMERNDDQALLNFVLEQLTDPDAFLNKVKSLYGSDAVAMDTLDFKDGRVFERYSFPMKMDGVVVGRVWSFRDITERRQTEEALRESKDQFRKVVENSPLAMALVKSDGIIEYINLKAIETFGYLPQDIPDMDRWWVQAYPEKTYREEVIAQWMGLVGEALAHNHEIEQREYCVTCKDGSVKVAAIFGVWIADKVLVIFDDITERKQAEMELEKYRTQLEKLVEQRTKELSLLNDQLRQSQKLEAVGILAGGIAHEFSNILSTMKGSMYLIDKKLPKDSPVMKYAEQILASINKANTLSQGLLTFSRKQAISLSPVHFNEIIHNVGKMLIQLIGEDIELEIMLSDKNATVMADKNQIEQVLVNLTTNARDAMPDGGRLTIVTDIMKMDEDFKKQHGYGVPGEYVVLTISDSGTGMEEAISGKIFEPFFTTKAVGKGSGLGLAVTYGIVKQHNGFIDVESVYGKGTTFRIYFPTVEAEVSQPAGQDRPEAIGGTETVLLAEDDEDARATMSEMLRITGYTVLEAKDGEEAIRMFMANKDRVQLVFVDVRMPKKNGRVVYEEIKVKHPQTKFLFISGYTADIMDSLGVSEGGINFISKAALPDEILRKIREVLDQ